MPADVDVWASPVPVSCPYDGYLSNMESMTTDYQVLVTITDPGIFLGINYTGAATFDFHLAAASAFLPTVIPGFAVFYVQFLPEQCPGSFEPSVACTATTNVTDDGCTPDCMIMDCMERLFYC